MFTSFTSYTICYFTLSVIFFSILIFEKKFMALEDKFFEKLRAHKQMKKREKAKKLAAERKNNVKPVHSKTVNYTRKSNYAA